MIGFAEGTREDPQSVSHGTNHRSLQDKKKLGGARVTHSDSFPMAERKGLSLWSCSAVICVHGEACCVDTHAPSYLCSSRESAYRLPAEDGDGHALCLALRAVSYL